jgi:3-oxoacyl-[acyl-carrier protein] reductase
VSEMDGSFARRVALITGGGGDVGRALALRLAADGAAVVVADIDEGKVEAVAGELKAQGGRALALPIDVARSEDADRVVRMTLRTFGRLDFLVNCAKHRHQAPVSDLSERDWSAMLAVQLTGTFLSCRAAVDPIVTSGGRVVNTMSVDGFRGRLHGAHFAAVNAGVVALTKVLACELAPTATANAVAIGTLASEGRSSPSMASQASASLLGRMGEPRDVVEAVMFFLNPSAEWITGQVLHVNGGEFMP